MDDVREERVELPAGVGRELCGKVLCMFDEAQQLHELSREQMLVLWINTLGNWCANEGFALSNPLVRERLMDSIFQVYTGARLVMQQEERRRAN